METYRHHVSGFFADRKDAEKAFSTLVERGLPRDRLYIFDQDQVPPVHAPQASSKEVRDDMLVDAAIGTAAGAGIGALAEVALVAANVSLFVASPLLAPLIMMGWGASVGGILGATAGAGDRKKFAALVRDAVSSGQIVLVAETSSKLESEIAREVIEAAVGEYNDVSTAA